MPDEERGAARRAMLTKQLAAELENLAQGLEVVGDATREAGHAVELLKLDLLATEKDHGS